MIYKNCPNCGMQIILPELNQSGDRQEPYRSCICPIVKSSPSGSPGDLSDLYKRMGKLEDWMDIMLHLIPNGQPYRKSFSGVDLNEMQYHTNPPILPGVLAEVMKQNACIVTQYKGENPKSNLHFAACLYCGYLTFTSAEAATGFGGPQVFVDSKRTCYACNEIKVSSPQVFEWMTKILLLAYRAANYREPIPVQTVMKHRNILIDNENPGVAAS